jgi:AcrR family transcriptional regulator
MPAHSDARGSRERLLHAAAEVFAARGVDAPVTAIADRAGVTKVTLYRHFRSKEELLLAIMADHYERLADVADELAGSGSTALETYMERAAVQLAPDRAYFHVALTAGAESEALETSALRLHEAVRRLLEAAQADGAIRDDLDAGDIHSLLLAATSTVSWRRNLALLLDAFEPSSVVLSEPPLRFEDYGRIQGERARRRRA